MFSYSTGYYIPPPVDQYLKFKNRCSLMCSAHKTYRFLAHYLLVVSYFPGCLDVYASIEFFFYNPETKITLWQTWLQVFPSGHRGRWRPILVPVVSSSYQIYHIFFMFSPYALKYFLSILQINLNTFRIFGEDFCTTNNPNLVVFFMKAQILSAYSPITAKCFLGILNRHSNTFRIFAEKAEIMENMQK